MKAITLLLWFFFCCLSGSIGQQYHAVHGSLYAGSLGTSNNPASIVHTPLAWDITVLGVQYNTSTNSVRVKKYPFTKIDTAAFTLHNGNFKRHASVNTDIRLLNTRIAISRTQAIAFGLNFRGYAHAKTSRFQLQDTISSFESFLKMNELVSAADASGIASGWVELYATYGRTLWDRPQDRLNAGITVKVNRGLAGGFARLDKLAINQSLNNEFVVENGSAEYGYSANLDKWVETNHSRDNLRQVMRTSQGSVAVDAGIEYILKTGEISDIYDDDDFYDYNWKVGLSLLDLGYNHFIHSKESRSGSDLIQDATGNLLEKKFTSVDGIGSFNDSLATIVNTIQPMTGPFQIFHPARIVLNADKYITGNYFINGELSFNLASLAGKNKLMLRELNFLTVTPRWERRRLGVYMPVQFNTQKQFWLGAAFKAGPLLLGFHNLGNIFSKNRHVNGGGYIAFVIRPTEAKQFRRDRKLDCPIVSREL
ncbi:MAG TPA: hypothetical protein VM012_15135 [Flavitalea sp.]|nr:hypothetical protein [Flavitalea sp.]